MITSFACTLSKNKAADDIIFAANAKAIAAVAKYGSEKITNGTIGAIMDDAGKLVCLPTVEKVYRGLPTEELIAYAPISGLPEYLDKVQTAAFGKSKPAGYTAAIATAGGTGSIHHAIWNYTEPKDIVLTANWYWGAYKVLCRDMGRELQTYTMLDAENKFNLAALEAKVKKVLAHQTSIMVIINTPAHNPTGYSLTEHDLSGVVAMLKKVTEAAGKRAVLFLDVAYLDYAGDKDEVRRFFKALDHLPETIFGIVGYSMSKGFTMYGQRTGAMIGVSGSQAVIKEFADINQYTSRATWSNINRPSMRTLAVIYSDPQLLKATEQERDHYYKMIKARADVFVAEAKACGLPMIPYMAGFFLSIPSTNSTAVCDKLHKDGIFVVPLAAGVRVALCSIPLKKIYGMAAKINAALQAVGNKA